MYEMVCVFSTVFWKTLFVTKGKDCTVEADGIGIIVMKCLNYVPTAHEYMDK